MEMFLTRFDVSVLFLGGKDLDIFTCVLKSSLVSQTVLSLGQLSAIVFCLHLYYHTLGFFEEISDILRFHISVYNSISNSSYICQDINVCEILL